MNRPWRLQLVSVGTGTELARTVIAEASREAGLSCDVWDVAGFIINPSLHTHAACVRAVYEHDIVIGLVDRTPGSTFAIDEIPADMAHELRTLGVLPSATRNDLLPSIFHVEVLTAKALGRAVLVMIPEDVMVPARETIRLLTERPPTMLARPTARRVLPIESYTTKADWYGLHSAYEVPELVGIPFSHVVFIHRLLTEQPNWCFTYRRGDAEQLRQLTRSGLRAVPLGLSTTQPQKIRERMSRQRDPLGRSSIADLFTTGRILDPPYLLDSGTLPGLGPLLPSHPGRHTQRSEPGRLVLALRGGQNTLLLGEPGLGKSTSCLLAAHAASTSQGIASDIVLFGTWRELVDLPNDASYLIRRLIGASAGRDPWPQSLALPDTGFRIILDGLDESPLPVDLLRERLSQLRELGSLLVSCRTSEFERRLHPCAESFDIVIRMLPWGPNEIADYVAALEGAGLTRAADYIRAVAGARTATTPHQSLLSFPLWLSMVTYLAEREGQLSIGDLSAAAENDYSLLLSCGQAVAMEECRRHGVSLDDGGPRLERVWADAAWVLYRSLRRDRVLLNAAELFDAIALPFDDSLRSPARSMLLEFGGKVVGFAHEVLLEFWLARRILASLSDAGTDPSEIIDMLSLQRSLITNRLVRHGIRRSGAVPRAAAALRSAYATLGDGAAFTKNQLLYMLGRIDGSDATQEFLGQRWSDGSEPLLVQYSAGWASVIAGDDAVETEFYARLRDDAEFSRINLGYHRYYYGDIYVPETQLPVIDDGVGACDGAVTQILDRLHRQQEHHRRLRRIELLTLRRFVESRALVTPLSSQLRDVCNAVTADCANQSAGQAAGIMSEVRELRDLLPSAPCAE